MKTIYQRADCDENSHLVYLGCCYQSKYELEKSINDYIESSVTYDSELWETLEDVRGSWEATIETKDRTIYQTTFHALIAYRRPYDHKEEVLGYIEHIIY